MKTNYIHQGDCIEFMKKLPSKSIDLTFADPPFNAKKGMGKFSRKYSLNIDNKTDKEYKLFCKQWFREARRISKRLLFTPGISHEWKYPEAIWIIAIEQPSAVKYSHFGGFNVWEPLLVYDKPLKRIPRDMVRYDCRNLDGGPLTKHPCPDNIEMVKWIIDFWSEVNDIVFDPFLGSGTTAVAAKLLNRKFIGCEISREYCDIAEKRLSQGVIWDEIKK